METMTMARIAEALNVTHKTISKDLQRRYEKGRPRLGRPFSGVSSVMRQHHLTSASRPASGSRGRG